MNNLERVENMVPCSKCRFSKETRTASWPIACHRHAPTMPYDNEDTACWPSVSAEESSIGCGDGEVKESNGGDKVARR